MLQHLKSLLLIMGLVTALAACETEGPMEQAGEEIDDAVENVGDKVEDATD